jgi:hypothetical protein
MLIGRAKAGQFWVDVAMLKPTNGEAKNQTLSPPDSKRFYTQLHPRFDNEQTATVDHSRT